jgi:hypothetical protein
VIDVTHTDDDVIDVTHTDDLNWDLEEEAIEMDQWSLH